MQRNDETQAKANRERLAAVVARIREQHGPRAQELAQANEAKTRLLVIDEVLVALGWPKESFAPETRTSEGTYIDYLVTLDRLPRFVVEAKRLGHTFAPSTKRLRQTEYLLSYMRQAFGSPFADVLRQAEAYCREVPVPFAVLTNGAEWILTQVQPPPGVGEERLKCYYFGNLFDDSPNLDLMWELLSASAVAESQIEEAFSQLNSLEAEYCVEPRSLVGEIRWGAPPDRPHLDDFYHCFFDEIIDPGRRKMLEHCYVTNPRLDQYHGELKRTLVDTAPSFLDNAEELTPGDTMRVLPDGGDKKGRVVLVVGSVGAGKTTFVTKTLVENRDISGLLFLTLDLIDEAVLHESSPPDRLWDLLFRVWSEKEPDALDFSTLKQAFHLELEQLRRGSSAEIYQKYPDRLIEDRAERLKQLTQDPANCLRRMWPYLAQTSGRRFVVFLDNVDRASEAFQHRMYAFAHAVAADTGATMIVTMRESTYYRAKDSGFLDVRTSDKVFHLQAPNVVQLVSKRTQYVEKWMERDHRVSAWKRDKDWNAFHEACKTYARALKQTFLVDSSGQDLLAVLAALAWHNIRAFLATLKRVHLLLEDGDRAWSESRVLATLLAADTSGSLRSIPATVYRPPSAKHSCFLLKLRLLLLLKVGVRQLEHRQGVGYHRLIEFGRLYGYRRRWMEAGVVELVRERLVECLQIPSEVEHTSRYELDQVHLFRLSPLGILVLEVLQFRRIYLAATCWEIPYHEKQHLDEFMAAARDAMGVDDLSQCELDRDYADLLPESSLPEVAAAVLSAAYSREQALARHVTARPEVHAVEEKLGEILRQLGSTTQDSPTNLKPPVAAPEQTRLALSDEDSAKKPPIILIRVPSNLKKAKLDGSTTAPAILWVLVFAHVNVLGPLTGAAITRLINELLRDDVEKLEAANVSRLLRGPVMENQTWLIRSGEARKHRFSLGEGWRSVWHDVFSEDPPV